MGVFEVFRQWSLSLQLAGGSRACVARYHGEGSTWRMSLHQPRENEERWESSIKTRFSKCERVHIIWVPYFKVAILGPMDREQQVLGWVSGRRGRAVDPTPTLLLHNS
jgi:hypothetical protein